MVYNGEGQRALSDSPLYIVTGNVEYTDAGIYSVPISLTDPENYTFENGDVENAYAIFEILPYQLSVSVDDVRLRLFEKLSRVDYVITAGELFGDDILTVTPYAEGKRVLVRSDNPNYTLKVASGRIIRLPYPTVRGGIIITSSILLLFFLLLGVLVVLRQRHRIVSVIAMLKCRWHNRGYKAPMPKAVTEAASEDLGIAESFDKEIESLDTVIDTDGKTDESEDTPPADERDDIALVDFEVDAERADGLITDSLAKSLINREGEIVYTKGSEREIINVDLLSRNFAAGERVDVNSLKKKGLISQETAYIKVLGGGSIDKPLMVFANDFSLSAVKMIALTGGQVTKVVTFKERSRDEKD